MDFEGLGAPLSRCSGHHLRACAELVLERIHLRRRAPDARGSEIPATTHHSFGGSFSDGSKPIFASKYAFFKAFFKIYKKIIFSRANFANFCRKTFLKAQKFAKVSRISENFCIILQNLPKNVKNLQTFPIFCSRNLQDLLARR